MTKGLYDVSIQEAVTEEGHALRRLLNCQIRPSVERAGL